MNNRALFLACIILIIFTAGCEAVTQAVQDDTTGREPVATPPGDMANNAGIPPAANGVKPGSATVPPGIEIDDEEYEPQEPDFTTNTDLPPMVIGGVQFYDLGKVFTGYRRCTDVIQSASAFKTVYNELKASYGNTYTYRYNEKKATGTAEWMSKDGLFTLTVKLAQRAGKMCLEMYISKWKND